MERSTRGGGRRPSPRSDSSPFDVKNSHNDNALYRRRVHWFWTHRLGTLPWHTRPRLLPGPFRKRKEHDDKATVFLTAQGHRMWALPELAAVACVTYVACIDTDPLAHMCKRYGGT